MPITKTQRAFVLDRDGSRCFLCGATAEQEKLEVDHWFPKALGGSDDIENLITLCQPCNRGKGKMYFGRYVALVRERVVARPLHRADIVPPLAYQADVISQIGQHLLTSGVPRVTLAQLVRLLTNLSLRDRINPAFEPLSFPLVEEGLQALVASGELTPEGDETFAIQTPSAAKKVGASRQLETDVGLLALGDLVKSEPIAAIKEAYTNIERELQVILEAHVPGKYDVGDRGVVDRRAWPSVTALSRQRPRIQLKGSLLCIISLFVATRPQRRTRMNTWRLRTACSTPSVRTSGIIRSV